MNLTATEHKNLLVAAGCSEETAMAQRELRQLYRKEFAAEIRARVKALPDHVFRLHPYEFKEGMYKLIEGALSI